MVNERALIGGRYRLGELLGVGATACVYAATDVAATDGTAQTSDEAPADAISTRLALKILHPHLGIDAAAREAFLRQSRLVQALRHPNIMTVFDSGLHDGGGLELAWMAIERVDGGSAADRVATRGPLPAAEASSIAAGLLAALDVAHRAGLVHRDVTPTNVLLNVPPGHDVGAHDVKLADFGISVLRGATAVAQDSVGSHRVIGTAHYVSPEHALGRPVEAAGDLYQVGAVLHFLLTGHPPFERRTQADVLAAHVNAPATAPSALVPSARTLDRAVTKALAKSPSARYRSAIDFAAAVAEATASVPASSTGEPAAPGVPAAPSVYNETVHNETADNETADAETVHAEPVDDEPATTRELTPATIRPLAYLDDDLDHATISAGAPGPSSPWVGAATAVLGIVVVGLTIIALVSAPSSTALGAPATPSSSSQASPSPHPAVHATAADASATIAAPATVTVPACAGTLAEAQAATTQAGLVLGTVSEVDSASGQGWVLAQDPAAGAEVAVGSTVNVTVASGYNAIPTVTGLTVSSAASLLENAGFAVITDRATVTETSTVLGTRPAAPMALRLGTTVTMLVAAPTPDNTDPTAGPTPTPTPTPDAPQP